MNSVRLANKAFEKLKTISMPPPDHHIEREVRALCPFDTPTWVPLNAIRRLKERFANIDAAIKTFKAVENFGPENATFQNRQQRLGELYNHPIKDGVVNDF